MDSNGFQGSVGDVRAEFDAREENEKLKSQLSGRSGAGCAPGT